MKIPLRYQATEYDCFPTSCINALIILFGREEIPIELIKIIYEYSLDEERNGVIGKGGTSRENVGKIAYYFSKYAKENNFPLKASVLNNEKVTLNNISNSICNGGVAIARCWLEEEHYVIITSINDKYAYIFDPYIDNEDYYSNDSDVIMVNNEKTYNRKVKLERLFSNNNENLSLLPVEQREVILLEKV